MTSAAAAPRRQKAATTAFATDASAFADEEPPSAYRAGLTANAPTTAELAAKSSVTSVRARSARRDDLRCLLLILLCCAVI